MAKFGMSKNDKIVLKRNKLKALVTTYRFTSIENIDNYLLLNHRIAYNVQQRAALFVTMPAPTERPLAAVHVTSRGRASVQPAEGRKKSSALPASATASRFTTATSSQLTSGPAAEQSRAEQGSVSWLMSETYVRLEMERCLT
jgi:hypothetical protein